MLSDERDNKDDKEENMLFKASFTAFPMLNGDYRLLKWGTGNEWEVQEGDDGKSGEWELKYPPKKVIVRDWELGRGNCVSNSIYIAIHHFQRGHNTPYLPPKILPKHCSNFSWEFN